jgi:hypothetical protein
LAEIRSSFDTILASFRPAFNVRSFANCVILVTGWLLAEVRGLPSQALRAHRDRLPKHHACYYDFFGRAVWEPDALGILLLKELLPFVPDPWVTAVVDDTLARKRGRHIWGANVHHDPLAFAKPQGYAFGHAWVVLSILVKVPGVERRVAVPIFWRLYRSQKKRRGKNGKGRTERKVVGAATPAEHRTRPQLAVEMLAVLRQALGDRPVRLLGDSTYAGKSVARHLPEGVTLVSRMTMKASLFARPPALPGKNGRPRKKGDAVPGPVAMAADKSRWRTATVTMYGQTVAVKYKTTQALWYQAAGTTLVRVVVVRDPRGRRKDECFYSTDAALTPEQVLEAYALRWSLEVAFRDGKQDLGFERPQSRTRKAVERTAPFAFFVYGLTVLWYAREGHRCAATYASEAPWYRHKRTPSFADMLHALRRELRREQVLQTPWFHQLPQNLREPLQEWLDMAA